MPIALAIFGFFGMEMVYLLTINNLEAGFLPALVFAAATYGVSLYYCRQADQKRDHPSALSYKMPPPKAFAVIKKTLRRFRWGERRWTVDADRSDLSINAVCEWHDRSWKDKRFLAPEGQLFRQVILDVSVQKHKESGLTDVFLNWTVSAELFRPAECNALQNYTTAAIVDALDQAQTVSREYEADDDVEDE